MKLRLVTRAIFFTLLMPGTVTVLIPYSILGSPTVVHELSVLHIGACIIGLTGGGVLLYCIWGFAFLGGGTLAPVDPPKILVVRGLYRYTRNPMYHSVLFILLSTSLFFRNWGLLLYAGIVFGCFHLFVVLYEEPHLRKQFGHQYLEYCRAAPRWGVSFRSFNNGEGR